MSDKPEISDNPSLKEMEKNFRVAKLLSKIPFLKFVAPPVHDALSEFLKKEPQFIRVRDTPDAFNKLFSKLGWTAYESISLDVMEKAVMLHDTEGKDIADTYLVDTYDRDAIRRGLLSFSRSKHFKSRLRLLKLAEVDYLEGRYHACIPLLLSLLDGIVNDITNDVGFFAKEVDLMAQDSIAGHETGLQALAKMMSKSSRKTNENPISIPYRHGILHGRELAFDNKSVAAKCWAALFAVKNWEDALDQAKEKSESEKKYGLKQFYDEAIALNQMKNATSAWQRREMSDINYLPSSGGSNSLPENTPEHAVAEFLENWQKQRFQLICDLLASPKKAIQAKNDFGENAPISFKVLSIDDTSSVVTKVKVELTFQKNDRIVSEEISIVTNYLDDNAKPLVRSYPNGEWKVVEEGSLFRVMSLYRNNNRLT